MDINSYILRTAKLINEGRDWEVGEDDYEAEKDFRNDEETASAKDAISGDNEEQARYEEQIRQEIVQSGDDEVVKEEFDRKKLWADIMSGKFKEQMKGTERKSGGRGVKSFRLDKVTVNGKQVLEKKLKSAFSADDQADAPGGDDAAKADDAVKADEFAKANDFSSPGAYAINPGDEVKVDGSVTFADGEEEKVEGLVVQGEKNPDAVMTELMSLTGNKYVKKGVCEYYAVMALMLKGAIKDLDDQGVALYEMYDRMNKDSKVEKIPGDEESDGSEDGDEGGDEDGGSRKDRFDNPVTGATYDDDYAEADPDSPEGWRDDYRGLGDYYNESVGKSFVKWACLAD